MVKNEPVLVEEHHELHDEELTDDEAEISSGSKVAAIFQKPFDFISMMVQFVIYFMVRMATEGCMLPIPELEGHDNHENHEEDHDENYEHGHGSKRKDD